MLIVKCPQCGEKITVKGIGRPRLEIAVNKVYDALQRHHSLVTAAKELKCSQAYIYKILKNEGQTVRNVLKGKVAV